MLYLPAGQGVPARVHGAFVGDDEVHRVVDDWKKRGTPDFVDEITSDLQDTGPYQVGLMHLDHLARRMMSFMMRQLISLLNREERLFQQFKGS